jgi:hypothetical protein
VRAATPGGTNPPERPQLPAALGSFSLRTNEARPAKWEGVGGQRKTHGYGGLALLADQANSSAPAWVNFT